jgi:hypothetical protein
MKENLKSLLFKDLCSRLPYGVKCRQHKLDSQICTLCPEYLKDFDAVEEFEPYLRPLSSMTEEEKQYIKNRWCYEDWYDINDFLNHYQIEAGDSFYFIEWLYEHHFDFRNLIGCKLAIEVTEENNPYKNDI